MTSGLASIQWVPLERRSRIPGVVRIIDQTRLPGELVYLDLTDVSAVAEAIVSLRIRGAPLLGIAAAYAVVLAAQEALRDQQPIGQSVRDAAETLRRTRPTAVNLFVGLNRLVEAAMRTRSSGPAAVKELLAVAENFHESDRRACAAIGRHGADLIQPGARILTYCNTGILATGGEGTALAAVYEAHRRHGDIRVFACETRPLWQGARLTAWELRQHDIPVTVLCDNAAASLLARGEVQCVMVGADRIAANGDTANKVGTFPLALAAAAHEIPFYVLAPTTTFDPEIPAGAQIPIEHRSPTEVVRPFGHDIAPEGVDVYSPAFDITPAKYISALVTEKGVIYPPFETNIPRLLRPKSRSPSEEKK
ncbi:MAG: S-methyl-5-thioribose-1-phosphate isomerase [Verrucomicrobia bacterium]|nr:MAG: S-methyl-5-thioribose-1-phosphate isomerase [Verrucomicrobiota bacterium]